MTKISETRKQTLDIINNMPDDKIVYVFQIIKNLESMLISQSKSQHKNKNAFTTLMKYSGTLPDDFDYKKELQDAIEEKYGCAN